MRALKTSLVSSDITAAVERLAGLSPGALEALVVSLPVKIRRRLAKHFSPQALLRAYEAERNELLMRLAIGRWGTATKIATDVHEEIEAYRVGTWRFDRDRPVPSDAQKALLHALLTLTDGAVPSVRSLRRLFASVAKIGPSVGHGSVRLSKSKAQGSHR